MSTTWEPPFPYQNETDKAISGPDRTQPRRQPEKEYLSEAPPVCKHHR